jgi:hypothetical protein
MMYIILFIVIVLIVSAVSVTAENKPEKRALRETIKLFVRTSFGMAAIAVIIFLLSR